ncbi:chromosomal replication initiator protein DnaA [bacterium]|nr:chromosomal replication initiator protein DnaA [bacterium]
MNPELLWREMVEYIQEKSTGQSFEIWVKTIKPVSFYKNELALEVPSDFIESWLREKYMDLLIESITSVTGESASVKFTTPNVKYAPKRKRVHTIKRIISEDKLHTSNMDGVLNSRYTFDSFVVGASNRFAHAASLAVAQSPAKAYNPLFIYGDVGLGKTHLMQAIGDFVMSKNTKKKIVYISSEKFTNQFIDAVRNGKINQFRKKYRKTEVLLIDDIHFIAGKESTQEEFFHTFNELHDAHKQIVISSDKHPKNIPGLENRLISRFEWGLITDIQPPDLETRIAILQKKAEREGMSMPNDVAYLIADNIKANIRELEGALVRLIAFASLTGEKIDINLANTALKDIIYHNKNKQININSIKEKIVEYFQIRLSDLNSSRRSRNIVMPRQIAMYISRELTDLSLPEIGASFGGKDHTTVMHACAKIKKKIDINNNFRETIDKIKDIISY